MFVLIFGAFIVAAIFAVVYLVFKFKRLITSFKPADNGNKTEEKQEFSIDNVPDPEPDSPAEEETEEIRDELSEGTADDVEVTVDMTPTTEPEIYEDMAPARGPILPWIIAAILVSPLVIYALLDTVNGVLVIVNVMCAWIMFDIIFWIIKKIRKKDFKIYLAGIFAIVYSIAYLGSGWYFAHHVVETDYNLSTAKSIGGNLKIAQISDSHIGATMDGDGFAKHMETIQKTDPDVIAITGDYVDDGTTKEDMIKGCAALGKMTAKYGKYYINGNHDKGYYNYRDFSYEELCAELEKNGVMVLEDRWEEIAPNIVVIGRRDRSFPDRKDMKTLLENIPPEKYIIVLDHQPHDFDAQAAAKVDMVLCGHTHGGQMFPVGILGEVSGANDKTYGLETRGTTNFIVNSGIGDWEIDYKTGGAISEFGIINVKQEN